MSSQNHTFLLTIPVLEMSIAGSIVVFLPNQRSNQISGPKFFPKQRSNQISDL